MFNSRTARAADLTIGQSIVLGFTKHIITDIVRNDTYVIVYSVNHKTPNSPIKIQQHLFNDTNVKLPRK